MFNIPTRFFGRVALVGAFALAALPAFAADANRTVVSRVAPVYPELARRMHVSGVVVLKVTVSPDGSVASTAAASGHPLLVNAAQDAVKKWRFSPGSEQTESTVDVNFNDSH